MCIIKRRISCALFIGIGHQLQRCNSNISESQLEDDDDIYDGQFSSVMYDNVYMGSSMKVCNSNSNNNDV